MLADRALGDAEILGGSPKSTETNDGFKDTKG
jgi:hypothetical protein